MLEFNDKVVLVDDTPYGAIEKIFDDIYIFYSHSQDWSYSAKELRQIADKLDELNSEE